MGIDDQIKKAFQDIVAPEISALKGEIKRLEEKIDGGRRETEARFEAMDQKIAALRGEVEGLRREMVTRFEALDAKFTAEIRPLDARLDGLEREIKIAIEVRERLAVLEARLPSR